MTLVMVCTGVGRMFGGLLISNEREPRALSQLHDAPLAACIRPSHDPSASAEV